jgi:hypothetical protein
MSAPIDVPSPPRADRRQWLIAAAIGLGLLLFVFRDVVFRGRVLSNRDSGTFYYPLFDYLQQELDAGRLPLWNPYSNGGEPLLAAGTTSVLYPVKLLFFLPVSYWARYHLYILLHIALAAATCGWVARRWGASLPAATLAGLSYAFSGNVAYNHTNIICLCGAAWLPLALWTGDRLLRSRRPAHVPAFAVVLTLMALAGDVQFGYVAGLLVAFEALLLWLDERRSRRVSADTPRAPVTFSGNRFLLLGASAVLAVLLGAAQLAPSLAFRSESSRAMQQSPLSLYDLPAFFLHRHGFPDRNDTGQPPHWYDALLGDPPQPAGHNLLIYQWSLEPVRIIEFLWPVSSVFELAKWARNPWVATQYLGLLPLILGLGAWRIRNTDVRTRWLSWIVLLSFLAALGSFGPGRPFRSGSWSRELEWYDPREMSAAVGGLYWLLNLTLPLFSEFRFPAKFMVPATCGISLLAAAGFDRFLAGDRRGRVTWVVLAAASAAAALAFLVFQADVERWFQQRQQHQHWTDQVPDVITQTTWVLGRSALLAGILVIVWRSVPRRFRTSAGCRVVAWGLVLLTAVDVGLVQKHFVVTSVRADWEATPSLARYVHRAAALHAADALRPPRIFNPTDYETPQLYLPSLLSGEDRWLWHRSVVTGHQHVPLRIARVSSFGTFEFGLHRPWLDIIPVGDPAISVQPRRSFDAWGTQFFIIQETQALTHLENSTLGLRRQWGSGAEQAARPLLPVVPPLPPALPPTEPPIPEVPSIEGLLNVDAFPPAWIVHRVHPLEPIPTWNIREWSKVMARMMFPGAEAIDLRTEAFVEDPRLARESQGAAREWTTHAGAEEFCRLTAYAPNALELEAVLASPGLVVLSEAYDAGWRAEVSTDGGAFAPQPILRANRTMRGLLLPAGSHVVRMRYAPRSFEIGCLLSGLSLLGLGGWWLRRFLLRR